MARALWRTRLMGRSRRAQSFRRSLPPPLELWTRASRQKKKLPEPIYETLAENVIDRKKTNKGFTLKKTEFTIQVEILGKKFVGVAMTKKQAKYNASAAAWADLSGLPAPGAGIESMLREARNSATASQTQQ